MQRSEGPGVQCTLQPGTWLDVDQVELMVLEVIKMVVMNMMDFFALNGAIIGGFLEAFLVT